jgi:energy-coupling factor transporter ATP-binding protein EcfA2
MTAYQHNIVLFGETGAGKSSIVNMLVGNAAAQISGGGRGCTLESHGYDFSIGARKYRIHDTAGLNEGEAGRVPTNDAIVKLCKLLYALNDGVALLVFCLRAPRIRDSVKYNWSLFYDIICRRKVPIVVVVTCLEAEEDMDAWCHRGDNRGLFQEYGMSFNAIAGVAASRGKRRPNGTYAFQEEYDMSVGKLKTLISRYHLVTPWKVERVKWFRDIYETQSTLGCLFPRRVMVGKVREEANRLISECGMSRSDAERLAQALEKA